MLRAEPGEVEARIKLKPEFMAPNGYLHAGTVVSMADTCCGYGCVASLPEGKMGFTTSELKVNVFAHAMAHQGMLQQVPLFPYLGPGDIVPTAALSLTMPDTPRVHFNHYNDIPEVILTMAGEGALLATGQLYLQQGTHGVTTFLRKANAPEGTSYQISLIIIRMKSAAK